MLVFDPRQQYLLFVIECSDDRIGLSHNANSVFIVQSDGEVSPAVSALQRAHGHPWRQFETIRDDSGKSERRGYRDCLCVSVPVANNATSQQPLPFGRWPSTLRASTQAA